MSKKLLSALAALAMAGAVLAQDHRHSSDPLPEDGRQLVHFPPAMRLHTLANMRDHLEALSAILTALSAGRYGEAGRLAETRLGMDSPSAAGCRPAAPAPASSSLSRLPSQDHQMARYMPEEMRGLGLAMHQAASDFAATAATAERTGDGKPALVALSKVTGQCTACHSSFRVQ